MNWFSSACPFRSLLPAMLFGLVLGASLAGCSPFGNSAPPIPDSTFSQVLVEFHLLSSRHQRGLESPRGMRDSVFTQYGVDSTEFRTTLQYYSRHPKRLETIYDGVIDTLRALEDDLQRPQPSSASSQ